MVKKKSVRADRKKDQSEKAGTASGRSEVLEDDAEGRLSRQAYREQLAQLQLALVRVQEWVTSNRLRTVIILEGLGPAGKIRTAQRMAEGFDRSVCKVVSLEPAGKRVKGQWPFQRYVEHFPATGKLVIFDSSWYHEPAIERAMGACTNGAFTDFLSASADFERVLLNSGITLVKYWFSGREEIQEQRFRAHMAEPEQRKRLRTLAGSLDCESHSVAEVQKQILEFTDIESSPWHVVQADDRRRARLDCLSHLVSLAPGAPAPSFSQVFAEPEEEIRPASANGGRSDRAHALPGLV